MFVALRIVTLPDGQAGAAEAIAGAIGARAAALPGLRGCWAAPVVAGAVINAGDIVWRMAFATESEALRAPGTAAWQRGIAPLLAGAQVSTIGYRLTRPVVRRAGPGIWRALVFRVMPHAPPDLAGRLEEATLRLPRHVPEIRSWALSPVSYSEGPKAFTHIWEQEFDAVADLTGPYMTNPAHWGLADAFFDAEYPEYIVDPQLTQTVGAIAESIIAPTMP
jgi:hypothetical protein